MSATAPDNAPELFSLLEIWRALDFPETTLHDFENRVPTLSKSSYRLPAAAPTTVDEQQRSHPVLGNEPGSTSDAGPGNAPLLGLQA